MASTRLQRLAALAQVWAAEGRTLAFAFHREGDEDRAVALSVAVEVVEGALERPAAA